MQTDWFELAYTLGRSDGKPLVSTARAAFDHELSEAGFSDVFARRGEAAEKLPDTTWMGKMTQEQARAALNRADAAARDVDPLFVVHEHILLRVSEVVSFKGRPSQKDGQEAAVRENEAARALRKLREVAVKADPLQMLDSEVSRSGPPSRRPTRR